MKKVVAAAAILAMTMTACGNADTNHQKTPQADGEVGVITELETGEAETHVGIVPWEYQAGEEIDNLYYKTIMDEDGVGCYAVKQEDGTIANLPIDKTVKYTASEGGCYYEKYNLTYKLDGEDVTEVQYQLYLAPEETN